MKKVFFATVLCALVWCPQSFAAKKSSMTAKAYNAAVLKMAPHNDEWRSEFPSPSPALEEKSAKAIQAQEATRKIASNMDQEFFEKKMSPQLKKFRTDFLKLKTAEELDKLLVELDTNYYDYPADLKFIAAQAVPLRALRGLVWRLVPTVEGTKIAHSLVLTQVKSIAVNMKLLLPTEQWEAGFAYVTQPFVENGTFPFVNAGNVVTQFDAGSEISVQGYVRSVLIPMMRQSAARLEQLNLAGDMSVWDNKLLYGSGSFPTEMDRYALFGEVERHAALSNIYATLSELSFQSAYSMQGSLAMNTEIGRLYGVDGVLSKVDGVPASKRVAVIRRYPTWGVLFEDGERWTSDAWFFLTRSVDHGDKMWQAMKNRPVSETFMVTNAYALPFQRPVANRFENLKRLTQGPAEVRSFITDEKVTVNLKAYYEKPPRDLKQLYAIGFERGSEMVVKSLQAGTQNVDVKYRNFLYGRPNQWNLAQYKPYFPEVKTNQDLEKTARVLSQGWGTFVIAVPLLNYMN